MAKLVSFFFYFFLFSRLTNSIPDAPSFFRTYYPVKEIVSRATSKGISATSGQVNYNLVIINKSQEKVSKQRPCLSA